MSGAVTSGSSLRGLSWLVLMVPVVFSACSSACPINAPSARVPPATCADWSRRSEGEQLSYTVGLVHGVIGRVATDAIRKEEMGKRSAGETAGGMIEVGEGMFPLPAVLGEMKTRCANRPDLKVSAAAYMAIRNVLVEPKPVSKKD